MPNNLSATVPSGVLPNGVFVSFVEDRIYPSLGVTYHDGTFERSLIQDDVNPPDSIKTWRLTVRRNADDIATLRTFYEDHNGPLQSFYFYNPFEPESGHPIGSNWDESGDTSFGRHTVKFLTPAWNMAVDIPRTNVSIDLIEVA